MNSGIYDVIIIGGGPAGLTAAIYTAREKMKVLLLDKGICGGWLLIIDLVENYPGFPDGIKGMDLAELLKKQAQKFGAELIEFSEVKKITPFDNKIKVATDRKEYLTHTLIVATGTVPKKLNIPGEEEYTGKGVSHCATCDGPLFGGKDVIVVGGGNAAVEESLFLTKFAKKVMLVHRRDELRAAKILQEEVRNNKKIELLLNHKLVSIEGKTNVNSAVIEDITTAKQRRINTDGVFVFIGFLPNSKVLEGIVEFDETGYIKTNENMQTSARSIYAVGDIRSKVARQIVIACAEGAIAALSVREYLKSFD